MEAEEDEHPCNRPMHIACKEGALESACLLLDVGADINSRIRYGVTPLLVACAMGHLELVSTLLERGADPAMRDGDAWTALVTGTRHVAVIQMLLKDGRVPVSARCMGRTALWWACCRGYTETPRVLLVEVRRPGEARRSGKGGPPKSLHQRIMPSSLRPSPPPRCTVSCAWAPSQCMEGLHLMNSART